MLPDRRNRPRQTPVLQVCPKAGCQHHHHRRLWAVDWRPGRPKTARSCPLGARAAAAATGCFGCARSQLFPSYIPWSCLWVDLHHFCNGCAENLFFRHDLYEKCRKCSQTPYKRLSNSRRERNLVKISRCVYRCCRRWSEWMKGVRIDHLDYVIKSCAYMEDKK